MNPLDALTPKDKETIKHYIQLYAGVTEPAPMEQVLRVWNKQKRTLFKGFGQQLRVSTPVEIPRNDSFFERELKTVYEMYPLWDRRDAEYVKSFRGDIKQRVRNDFIFELLMFMAEQNWEDNDYFHASRLFLHSNIKNGYIETVSDTNGYHFQSFNATIKNGMRTMRTIQKVLKAMRFPRMDLFEDWRNRISDLNINREIKTNLVLSIHPIDFMTMSHNNCDWSSCMNWKDGLYSSGTIEMMNSNMAVVAYLESSTPFTIVFDEEEFEIPNKSWRSLFYVNKHIMVGGRAYPYVNNDLTNVCLDELMKLVGDNLKWKYQYKHQLYKDNNSIHNNFFLKRESLYTFNRPKNKKKPKRAIYLHTNCMYNDLIEYKDDYYCCRNWVPKTMRFCVSGPATCMCCGDYIEEPNDINSYDTPGDKKLCFICDTEKRCSVCGEIRYTNPKYILNQTSWSNWKICSDECLANTIYFPAYKKAINKESLANDSMTIVLVKDKNFFDKGRDGYFDKASDIVYNQTTIQDTKAKLREAFDIKNIISMPYDIFLRVRRDIGDKYITIINRPLTILLFTFIPYDESQLSEGKDIEEYITEAAHWVPAEEVLNENCSPVSF